MLATSTYASGTNDTASTLVNNVTATDAQQPNGIASAALQIEQILGVGTTLKGSAADLVARLAVLLQASGAIKDKDGGTTYTKWDGWMGYGASSLKKVPNMVPPGMIIMWGLNTIPSGWLELNNQQVSCTLYEDLFDMAIGDLDLQGTSIEWRRGTATHTVAQATDVNTSTDTITATAHGLSNGNVVHVKSSGTLPTGLSTLTKYYIIGATTNTYQLSATLGGAAIDITGVGSGTMSVYNTFQLPDYRGRSPIGVGTGSGLSNRGLNQPYGEETHTLTASESGTTAHTHREDSEAGVPYTALTGSGVATGLRIPSASNGSTTAAVFTEASTAASAASAHNVIHPSIGLRYLVRY